MHVAEKVQCFLFSFGKGGGRRTQPGGSASLALLSYTNSHCQIRKKKVRGSQCFYSNKRGGSLQTSKKIAITRVKKKKIA